MNDTESFPSLEALLHRLGLIGESAQVECKESLWQLPRDVWETVSAFSNTAGGTLLFEIENPGASLRDPDRLSEPGSELRNPRIAQMFYEIGWAEQKGAGIRAMQRAMDDLGLTPPTFESDPQDRSFRVTFYRHHFMDQSDLAWLEHFSALRLTTEEQKALVYARKTGRVDNAAFRSLNHTDTLTASRALTHLEGLGLLERSAQRRGPGVYYTLAGGVTEAPQVTPQVT
ncbi:MAG: ATP-binding protein, partial [Anaerolineae bacterium]